MSTQEFLDEFNLAYQYSGGNSAPGFSIYDISVFLTVAQEELVKDAFDPRSNRKIESFEQNEFTRRKLQPLIQQLEYTPGQALTYDPAKNFVQGTTIFSWTGEQPLWIISEYLEQMDRDTNCQELEVEVVPITHDEFLLIKRNPFRNKKKAWRLDTGTWNQKHSLEIYTNLLYIRYVLRYVRRPRPIILQDITTLPEGSFSIDGQTSPQTSELFDGFHREIVTRAVNNALEAVGDPRYQTHVRIDNRIE